MEVNGASQYSSIIVPSVQEMVKEKLITMVPPRYVRSDLDKADIDVDLISEIPVIDMNRLCSSTTMDSEINKLDFACKEWGFFQAIKLHYFLVNHGMDSGFLDKIKSEIQDLFNLLMEEKKKLWQQPGEIEGFGQAFVVSEEQKLDWADTFILAMHPVRVRKPHLFSKLPLPFRDTLDTYSAEVKSIAKILLAKMAIALKIKPEEMENLFGEEIGQRMRMNYYPPCPEPDQAIGLTPHSDSTGLTILLQVNEVEGLQIKKNGKWVSVKPLPNAFIVNIGDILEIITNGTYRSIEHRGVVNSEKERLSVATFHNPGMGKEISPLRNLVEKKKAALFRSVTTEEYFKGLLCSQNFLVIKQAAMEAKRASQYSSIIVPSVQEMVKEKMSTTIPLRYVRSDLDKAEIDGDLSTEIPIIDLNRLCSSTTMDFEIDKLDLACKEWGFFQAINPLVNHGMDSGGFLDKIKSEIQDLFNLPVEERKKLWQQPGEIEGFGQAFVVSQEQKLDWADTFMLSMQPVRVRKPDLFSKLPLPIRDTLDTYSTEVKRVAKILFAKMATALKIKPEEMENLFDEEIDQRIRINYYPPCPEPDKAIGVTPHSDASGLTILLQVNEVEGLQIKKNGKWVSVKPLPNAFVVNIGDILEIITNGTYRSIEHRGVVNSEKERLSVATFHNPGTGKEVGPLRSLIEREKAAIFKSVTTEEYNNGFFSRELNGKTYLENMRI
ncbi:unnamed protein product, partial [Thlaspi arvense]